MYQILTMPPAPPLQRFPRISRICVKFLSLGSRRLIFWTSHQFWRRWWRRPASDIWFKAFRLASWGLIERHLEIVCWNCLEYFLKWCMDSWKISPSFCWCKRCFCCKFSNYILKVIILKQIDSLKVSSPTARPKLKPRSPSPWRGKTSCLRGLKIDNYYSMKACYSWCLESHPLNMPST